VSGPPTFAELKGNRGSYGGSTPRWLLLTPRWITTPGPQSGKPLDCLSIQQKLGVQSSIRLFGAKLQNKCNFLIEVDNRMKANYMFPRGSKTRRAGASMSGASDALSSKSPPMLRGDRIEISTVLRILPSDEGPRVRFVLQENPQAEGFCGQNRPNLRPELRDWSSRRQNSWRRERTEN